MNRLGLGSADFKRYLEACAVPHEISVSVDLTNNDGDLLVSFDEGRGGGRDVTVTGGQVDVDASTTIGRTLSLTVADPSKQLMVSQDASFVDRMLQVSVGVQVASLSKTIWAKVFTGPIVSAPRAGDVVQFTANSKARFGQHGIKEFYTLPKGMRKTAAIKTLLHDLAGEPYSNMGDIPDLTPILRTPWHIPIFGHPWSTARQLADELTRHLCYDGSGHIRFQRTDLHDPVYVFNDARLAPGMVTEPPEQSADWSTIHNAVKIFGGVHGGGTGQPPIGYAFADPGNPFSPERLGRNGTNAYYWDVAHFNRIFTQAGVDRVAKNVLHRDLIASRSIKFESIPMYVFDELDVVKIDTPEVTATTHLSQFSIPLSIDGAPTTSYGWLGRVSANPFARRH